MTGPIESLANTAESFIKNLQDELQKEIEAHQKSVDDLLLHVHQREAYIERLRGEYNAALNELCLKCGSYRERHNGACDGCRFLEPQKKGGYID